MMKFSKLRIIELSVFVGILIISGIILYMSFASNTKEARDAKRTADLVKIGDALKLYASTAGKYPIPDEKVDILASGSTIFYQGYVGGGVFKTINLEELSDPDPDENFKYLRLYTYSTDAEQKNFQLMAFLEQGDEKSYNPLTKRTPYNYGGTVGIVLENETQRPLQETKLGIDLLQVKNPYTLYLGGGTMLKGNKEVLKHILGMTPKSISKSCLELRLAGYQKNGYYFINSLNGGAYNNFAKAYKVFCEMESKDGGWTRLYYKNGKESCFHEEITYNQFMFESLFTKDFAISDKLETLQTEGSWILKGVDFTNKDFDFVKLSNLANCKAPNGEEWSQSYSGGYLQIKGKLDTLGIWDKMFFGCDEYKNLNDPLTIRIGGITKDDGTVNAGEFIHSSCNNYSEKDHSITSKWDWDNTRVFWVR